MSLGQIIKTVRLSTGMTQKDFGLSVGLGKAGPDVTVSRYETGDSSPSLKTFRKMTEKYEFPGQWLSSNIWVDWEGQEYEFRGSETQGLKGVAYEAKEPLDHFEKYQIIKKYAKEAEKIYEERTAGDYTWEGLLYSFYQEIAGSTSTIMKE